MDFIASRERRSNNFNKDFDKALEDFEEALEFCLAVDMLMTHNRMSKAGASDEEIKKECKDLRR